MILKEKKIFQNMFIVADLVSLSCKVFHDWSIIKLGNILYLLDRSIFAVLFGTTSHCFC